MLKIDASADAASSLGTNWFPSWGSDGLEPDSAKPQRRGNRPGTPRPSFVEPLHSRGTASEESVMRNLTQEGRPASRCLAHSRYNQKLYLLQDHMLSTTSCRWKPQRPTLAMRVRSLDVSQALAATVSAFTWLLIVLLRLACTQGSCKRSALGGSHLCDWTLIYAPATLKTPSLGCGPGMHAGKLPGQALGGNTRQCRCSWSL